MNGEQEDQSRPESDEVETDPQLDPEIAKFLNEKFKEFKRNQEKDAKGATVVPPSQGKPISTSAPARPEQPNVVREPAQSSTPPEVGVGGQAAPQSGQWERKSPRNWDFLVETLNAPLNVWKNASTTGKCGLVAGAAIGASIGLAVDAATMGVTMGLGTIIGTGIGGYVGYKWGERNKEKYDAKLNKNLTNIKKAPGRLYKAVSKQVGSLLTPPSNTGTEAEDPQREQALKRHLDSIYKTNKGDKLRWPG